MLTFFAGGRKCTPASLCAYDQAEVTVYGLSTDEKPDCVPNAAAFVEMDTKKVYLYDAEGKQWLEQ